MKNSTPRLITAMRPLAAQNSNAKWAALFLAGTAALSSQVMAVDNIWTGTTSRDWNDPTNWSLGRVPITPNGGVAPNEFDDAVINTTPANTPLINATIPALRDILVANGAGTSGVLSQSAGNAATGGGNWMFVGTAGGNGTYNLADTAVTGGTLTGMGQSTGNLTVGGRLYVGGRDTAGGGTGTVNVNTTGTIAVGNDLAVGSAGGTGVMKVDAGNITTGGWNFIGKNEGGPGANGTLNMSGGTLTNTGRTYVGQAGSTGALNLSGGSYKNINNEQFIIGEDAGSNGTVNVTNAASLLQIGGEVWIGQGTGGNGRMTVSAGSVTVGNWVAVGRAGATGVLTINGTGLVEKGTGGSFEIGNNAASNGTVNLDGGTLRVDELVSGGGTSTFNFNGGVLKPIESDAGTDIFMQGLTTANVKAGGAIVNTDGFDITINQALLADAVSTGGGLTKAGAGKLTLGGVSTYTGRTIVSGGTLALSATGSLSPSSEITVAAGATFDGSAVAGGIVIPVAQTLDGNGTVVGTTTVNGTFAPGNSLGTLTITGDLVLAGTSTFELDTTLAPNSDLANVSGAVTYGGALNVSLLGGALVNGQVFNLFDAASFTGSFASLSLPTPTGDSFWINNLSVDGTLSYVPEPGTSSLALLTSLALLGRRRRRD